ncbi:uncharacterized protein ACWYII_011977 [Salvelinus alpinus]
MDPSIAETTGNAIRILSKNPKGFFLLVQGPPCHQSLARRRQGPGADQRGGNSHPVDSWPLPRLHLQWIPLQRPKHSGEISSVWEEYVVTQLLCTETALDTKS